MKKIAFLTDLVKQNELIKDKKKILVGGCFDLLHYGHLTFLRNAKKEGDFLIVALESDEFIKLRKKRSSIHNQEQRAEILAELEAVDLVVKLPLFKLDNEYFHLIKLIRPSVIAVTEGDSQMLNKKKQAAEIGAKLKTVSNLIAGFSTRSIIKNLDI